MSDVMWELEVEQACTDLEKGCIDRAECIRRLVRLGLDESEANYHCDAAEGNA